MRNFLILETSTDSASMALVIDGVIVSEKSFVSDRRHNAMLFAPLEEMFDANGRPPLDAVLVGSGPGSYSGTRVGIAAAQGAALVSGCKAIALPSILATPEALCGSPCLAVGDARRGSFWIAEIDHQSIRSAPELTDMDGFQKALQRAQAKHVAPFCMERIKETEIPISTPTASGLWHAWRNASEDVREGWSSAIPQPIYLAPPHVTASKKEIFYNKDR